MDQECIRDLAAAVECGNQRLLLPYAQALWQTDQHQQAIEALEAFGISPFDVQCARLLVEYYEYHYCSQMHQEAAPADGQEANDDDIRRHRAYLFNLRLALADHGDVPSLFYLLESLQPRLIKSLVAAMESDHDIDDPPDDSVVHARTLLPLLEKAALEGDPSAVAGAAAIYRQMYLDTRSTSGHRPPKVAASLASRIADKYRLFVALAAKLDDAACVFDWAELLLADRQKNGLQMQQALDSFVKSGELGNFRGYLRAASLLQDGTITVPGGAGDRQVLELCYRAAQKGSTAPTLKEIGDGYRHTADAELALAVRCYKEGADGGCPNSMAALGDCLWGGVGAATDRSRAVELWERSTGLGSMAADDCSNRAPQLLVCFWKGYGCARDPEKARALWQRLASSLGVSASEEQMLDAIDLIEGQLL
ncbi:uncharacterized protein BJ171DRAFT_629384 [Polychytrium aggregatum]|uniref:uncharacterized protein n=1 Tax=Polychytrium aggregatum TaxID=110093 RepID=UPI0022FE2440|nr:uncharacterized protein BJ171DRAFT_629384 [Polychytrium aggregatum]KAI9202000.1 hypothetical protein BJ171DRAFT_629384 [Polychytrium aggregatum]